MKSLSYHLILVHSSLCVLTEQVEQLCRCLEQLGAGAADGEGAVYSSRFSFTEALMNKKPSFDKATVRKPSSFTEAKSRRPEKSIIKLVYESIQRNHKGIAFKQIQKRTGFSTKQIANAIYKLKKKGMIEVIKRGIYIPNDRNVK